MWGCREAQVLSLLSALVQGFCFDNSGDCLEGSVTMPLSIVLIQRNAACTWSWIGGCWFCRPGGVVRIASSIGKRIFPLSLPKARDYWTRRLVCLEDTLLKGELSSHHYTRVFTLRHYDCRKVAGTGKTGYNEYGEVLLEGGGGIAGNGKRNCIWGRLLRFVMFYKLARRGNSVVYPDGVFDVSKLTGVPLFPRPVTIFRNRSFAGGYTYTSYVSVLGVKLEVCCPPEGCYDVAVTSTPGTRVN